MDQVTTRNEPLLSPPPSTGTRKRRIATLLALLLVAIAAGGWWLTRRATPVHYVTAAVTRGAVTRVVAATGTVNPVLTVIVGTYVSGVIQQISCDYNTPVKRGQICAKIDPRPYQAVLDRYLGELQRDRAILDRDRTNLARYQKLAAQDSIARQQVEDQKFTVQQDEGTVKVDEGQVEGARFNLAYTDIVSPVDGVVVSRNVTQGQTVAATYQTPTLFLIAADLKQMQVDSNVSESDIASVKEGAATSFVVDAYPNRVFHGTVTQVRRSPQTVQNVVTYDVVVSVDNSDLALMPGMTASTQIISDQRNDVLRVPDQALRYTPGQPATSPPPASGEARIWLLREGQAVPVLVRLGLDDDTYTEIISGDVKAGDQAIISAQSNARGGAHPLLPRF